MERSPPKKNGTWQHVDGCFTVGFPPTCRLILCASESEVSNRRRAGWKKSPAVRRSDDGDSDGGFQKENKVTGRKHDHQKKKIRFSPPTLIPCEERKGIIPNFIIFMKN